MPAIVVAAHPDDEVIGLGYRLSSLRPIRIIHLTDGAPRDMHDARVHGFATREAYACERRTELEQALSLLDIGASACSGMWFADQTAGWRLREAVELLTKSFREICPAVIITHPYEGGHPDHDAAAFAVGAALQLMRRAGEAAPVHLEFASYNRAGGVYRWLTYLPQPDGESYTMRIPEEGRAWKQLLLDCFRTQRTVLQGVPVDAEPLRIAPSYCFTEPPHRGTLNYEHYSWGMAGSQFRRLASDALRELGLEEPL